METVKRIQILILATILSIFLIGNASAIVVDGEWISGSQSATITDGESIDFETGISGSPPLTINVKLFNSQDNVISVFEDNKMHSSLLFTNAYAVNKERYGGPGSYTIRIIGKDNNGQSATKTLNLQVNALPQPSSSYNGPGIVSIPNFQINEGLGFGYQVILTGSSGSPYEFYLTQDSGWLWVGRQDGIIRGNAPGVNSDADYGVTVLVVDTNGATASRGFTITVKNVQPVTLPSTISPPDTNSPVVSITFPSNIEYDSQIGILNYTAVDAEGNLNQCWYSKNLGVTNSTPNSCTGSFTINSVEGINRWTVYASDAIGNVGSAMVTFQIDLDEDEDDDNDSDDENVNYVYEDPDKSKYESTPAVNPYINLTPSSETEKSEFAIFIEAIISFFKWIFS